MLKTNKTTSKPATKTASNLLKQNEKQKIKKVSSTSADKKIDSKKLTIKTSDIGLSARNVNSKVAIKPKGGSNLQVKSNEKTPIKKNVMNTIHNVTVASPPSSAKSGRSTSLINVRETEDSVANSTKHSRSRTRTIAPEDSILFQQRVLNGSREREKVKEPVSFEINFEEKRQKKSPALSSQKSVDLAREESNSKETTPDPDNEECTYESDFESYESDFEAETSNESSGEKSMSESDETELKDDFNEALLKSNKERIDSGSFDMSNKKSVTPLSGQFDSIDDTINSHDSGISYDDLNALSKRLLSPKVYDFYKRGEELMKKIILDDIIFDIFEQKPIPYEVFMSVYGQKGMTQVGTQSDSLILSEEVQTEAIVKLNAWSQFPAKFTQDGLKMINSKRYNEEKLGTGVELYDTEVSTIKDEIEHMSINIEAINNFSLSDEEMKIAKKFNYDVGKLNRFIQNAAINISNLIETNRELSPAKIPISQGFIVLKFAENDTLRNTIVTKLYTNLCLSNFLITIHKVKNTCQNYICLWNIMHISRPFKIFIAWSDVKCLEIHPQQDDLIIGGCNDGTICLWDIQELIACSEEEIARTIKPSKIISLNQMKNDFTLDNVIALKSLPHRRFNTDVLFSKGHSSQVCSLHENGILSIWTIVRVQAGNEHLESNQLDYIYRGSTFNLSKNLSIDLNELMKETVKQNTKSKSAFERRRYYFENDLFNDKALRELQEIDIEHMHKNKIALRDDCIQAISFDINYNELFVATDSSYIIGLSRLCLGDKMRKIFTNNSTYTSPSVIKFHPSDKNILAVGLSNGNVKFIKTNDEVGGGGGKQRKPLKRSNATSSIDDVLSKSCAFQNIVEKEKKLYDETQALNNLESDELKAFLVNEALLKQMEENVDLREKLKITFDKNIFNSFDICKGSIRLIEFNHTGEYMFVLLNKELKIYDCWKNAFVEHQESRKLADAKCVKSSDGAEYLVLLTADSEILVNKLKH